jgi:hypothetical protein
VPEELRSGAAEARVAAVGSGYFEVLGIPLVSGRAFGPGDETGGPPVAVVSMRLARSLWGDESAVGRHLELARGGAPPRRIEVVGVAAGHKHTSLTDADPLLLYVPLAQSAPDGTLLIARGRAGHPSRELLTELLDDADVEIFPEGFWTVDGLMSGWVSLDRRVSTWIGVFGVLAIFLAALGVYGVVAHVARERRREMAVRSALGALPRQLVVRLMGMGLSLSATGGLAGVLLLLWTQPLVERSLDAVSGMDLRLVEGCFGLLFLTMAVASFVPARRDARVDLVEVLRAE